MTESNCAGQAGDAGDLAGYVTAIRGRVRMDRRATSVPLLVLGGATALATLPALISPTSGWGAYPGKEAAGLVITVAFAAIWLAERRRASRVGVGTPRGFGTAALTGLAIVVIGIAATRLLGPFLTFAIGLLVAGRYQRNVMLMIWAVAMGVLGIVNNFHWISNRLPSSLWSPRVDPAINLALALLTVLAGIAWWLRESRAS